MPPGNHLPVSKIAAEALEGAVAYDVHIVPGIFGTLGIQAGEFLLEGRHEGVFDILVKEQIVRRDAGLAAVEALAPDDAARRYAYVGILIDDTRALPAEFEHQRSKILGLGLHHHAPESGAAREEHQIEAGLEEAGVDSAVAQDHGYIALREGLLNHTGEHAGDGRHIGRWLEDGRAARGNGAHKRAEQQLHRVVPGRDYERAAEGLADNVT